MAHRYGRVREVRSRARPHGQQLEGARGLVGAVLRQVLDDARSRNTDWRTEALHFLADEQAVAFWLDLAEIDHQTFRAHVRKALGPG
jgi:hypothetical protein